MKEVIPNENVSVRTCFGICESGMLKRVQHDGVNENVSFRTCFGISKLIKGE